MATKLERFRDSVDGCRATRARFSGPALDLVLLEFGSAANMAKETGKTIIYFREK